MKEKQLTIITVGYNESSNLPKMFESLKKLEKRIKIRKIYIDQESKDNSLEIAKSAGAEVYLHKNQGYADPDKQRAVEELCSEKERTCILDADEEITEELGKKIQEKILPGAEEYCFSVIRETMRMGIIIAKTKQLRIFQKQSVQINQTIHNYIRAKNEKYHIVMKEKIVEDDLKYKGKEVAFLIEKLNKYSDIEAEQYSKNISYYKITGNMLIQPIIRFFGHGIIHKLFFKGRKGIICCKILALYQFLIYSKIYEKQLAKK